MNDKELLEYAIADALNEVDKMGRDIRALRRVIKILAKRIKKLKDNDSNTELGKMD